MCRITITSIRCYKANYIISEKSIERGRKENMGGVVRMSVVSLAVVLVVAASSNCAWAAKTIEEVCDGSSAPPYCVKLLKPIVTKSTDFKSKLWVKQMRGVVSEKVAAANDYLMKYREALTSVDAQATIKCQNAYNENIKAIAGSASMDSVAKSLTAGCVDSLQRYANRNYDQLHVSITDLMNKTDEAIQASWIINDLTSLLPDLY